LKKNGWWRKEERGCMTYEEERLHSERRRELTGRGTEARCEWEWKLHTQEVGTGGKISRKHSGRKTKHTVRCSFGRMFSKRHRRQLRRKKRVWIKNITLPLGVRKSSEELERERGTRRRAA